MVNFIVLTLGKLLLHALANGWKFDDIVREFDVCVFRGCRKISAWKPSTVTCRSSNTTLQGLYFGFTFHHLRHCFLWSRLYLFRLSTIWQPTKKILKILLFGPLRSELRAIMYCAAFREAGRNSSINIYKEFSVRRGCKFRRSSNHCGIH